MGKLRRTQEDREEEKGWLRRRQEIALNVTENDSTLAKMIARKMRGGDPGHRVEPAPRLDQLDRDFGD